MAARISGSRPAAPRPILSVLIVPGVSGSRVNILMGADLLGRGYRPPVGTLGIRLRASDLVGLTPAAGALKALHHVVRTLEHIVSTTGQAEPPAPPEGATGAALQVPGQLGLEIVSASDGTSLQEPVA